MLQEAADGYGLGYIPPLVDLSHLKGQNLTLAMPLNSFPSSYDLRNVSGKLPPVRNQGSCGSCWAFASYGSLESVLRPAEAWDFSEMDMNCSHGFNWLPCEGANQYVAMAYLARWDGPVMESCYPYNPPNCTNPRPSCPLQKQVTEVIFLPPRSSSLSNDNIKQMVTTYGAVYTSFYWNSSDYRSATASYYYSGPNNSNHAVCIVGWDDNYSKDNFSSTPPGDGAFIIRNSWGSGWGEGGYFYISYYDSKVGKSDAVFSGAQSAGTYDRCYDYDPLGWVSNVGYGSNTAWGANIFTAVADEPLVAASFYVASTNSPYELYIYRNCTSGPRTGSLSSTKTGTIATPGYVTITLDTPVSLSTGEKFSVVVKLTTPGYNYPIPFEYPISGYSSAATASSGQSYMSSNGSSWTDMTSWKANSNACLKAFTGSACTPPNISEHPQNQTKCEGETASFSVTASGTEPLSYQWQKLPSGGSWGNIDGATSSIYTTPTLVAGDDGNQYKCAVSNSCGNVESDAATLTVKTAASIISHPLGQAKFVGETATFSVTASGSSPLSYQWQINDGSSWVDIDGAQDSSYTTPVLEAADDGNQYRCKVSNDCGEETSNAAILIIDTEISISQAKQLSDDTRAAFRDSVVTAIFSDYFYVSQPDRAAGVRVVPAEMPVGLTIGDLVDVHGLMKTNADDERYVEAAVVAPK